MSMRHIRHINNSIEHHSNNKRQYLQTLLKIKSIKTNHTTKHLPLINALPFTHFSIHIYTIYRLTNQVFCVSK